MDCLPKQVAVVERWANCGEVAVSGDSSVSQLLIGLRHNGHVVSEHNIFGTQGLL